MKLSVVTIGRNAGEGLRDTANAVLGQSRLPDEYLVQDGDSSDGSVAALVAWLGERYLWENAETLKAEMLKGEGEPQNTQNTQNEVEKRKAKTDDGGENAEMLKAETLKCKAGDDGGSREAGGRVCLWGRDCEIKICSEEDAGIYDALNRGIARAQGDVIGLLHADDAYAGSNVLELVMQAFEKGAEAVYGDLQYVRYAEGTMRLVRNWRSGAYDRRQLPWGWMPPHPTLFLRRDVYARAALPDGRFFDPTFRCAGDYDFILRVLPRLQVPPVYIPRVFVRMRTGGISNRNLSSIVQKSREDWLAIRRNKIGSLHTLLAKNLRKVGQFRVAI